MKKFHARSWDMRHPKCKGYQQTHDPYDYDCEYETTITCDECKYGVGRKDPEAKCNQPVHLNRFTTCHKS